MFHESKLKVFLEDEQFPSRKAPDGGVHTEPPSDPSEVPQVETILEQKVVLGPNGLEFVDLLIRWKACDDDDSWVPAERVAVMAPELYEEFLQHQSRPLPLLGPGSVPDLGPAPLLLGWKSPSPPEPVSAPKRGHGGLLAQGTHSRPEFLCLRLTQCPRNELFAVAGRALLFL